MNEPLSPEAKRQRFSSQSDELQKNSTVPGDNSSISLLSSEVSITPVKHHNVPSTVLTQADTVLSVVQDNSSCIVPNSLCFSVLPEKGDSDSDSGLDDSGSQESCAAESSSEFYQSVSWNDVDSSNASEADKSDVSSKTDEGEASLSGNCSAFLSSHTAGSVPLGSEVTIETSPDPVSRLGKRKRVVFERVHVFYFDRAQGFTCVPSQGGSTLGMASDHWAVDEFSVASYQRSRRRERRAILHQHCLEGTLTLPREQREALERNVLRNACDISRGYDEDDAEVDSEDDEESTLSCVEDYYFLQPVPIKRRRMILREAGIQRIDHNERTECQDIRLSRELCGCECPGGICVPEHCSCSQAGIQCQVDRANFPCACVRQLCHNQTGRVEFNPVRVKTHYIHTQMRLEMEKHGYDPSGDVEAASDPASSFNSTEKGSCRDCQNQAYMQAVVHELRQSGLLSSPAFANNSCQQQQRVFQPMMAPVPANQQAMQVSQPSATENPSLATVAAYPSDDEEDDEEDEDYEDIGDEQQHQEHVMTTSIPNYHQQLDPITTLLPSSDHHYQQAPSHHSLLTLKKTYHHPLPPQPPLQSNSCYATLQPVNPSQMPASYLPLHEHLVPVPPVAMQQSPPVETTNCNSDLVEVTSSSLCPLPNVDQRKQQQLPPSTSLGEVLKTSLIETVRA